MVNLVACSYVPLDATSSQRISTLGRGGPTHGARYFPFTYMVRLTMGQHQEEQGYSTLAVRFSMTFKFPTWLLCFHSGAHGEVH